MKFKGVTEGIRLRQAALPRCHVGNCGNRTGKAHSIRTNGKTAFQGLREAPVEALPTKRA